MLWLGRARGSMLWLRRSNLRLSRTDCVNQHRAATTLYTPFTVNVQENWAIRKQLKGG